MKEQIPWDVSELRILHYPDPRLRAPSRAVEPEEFGPSLRALADRLFELMLAVRGVGLAAPQVGVCVRLFVAMPTTDPKDRRAYANPRLAPDGEWQEGEEGCLSFPGISCKIKRYARVTIEALDLDGKPFQETAEGLAARIVQHEYDHLDGKLLVDRMGTLAHLANRTALKHMEEDFAESGKVRRA